MQLFHGSSIKISKPEILTSGHYKDFGFGFYCTNIEKQAKKWALTKRPNHVINKYSYAEDKTLKIISYRVMTEEWLDFVVACRSWEKHDFDIVEGPMADDTIWDYIEDYVSGEITREAFWVLVKFKYPTHQITFCSSEALRTLTFEGSYKL